MNNKAFLKIKKNLKKDFSNLKKVRLAILGDSSTQFLNTTIKGLGYDYDINCETWEAGYDQIPLQVFDPSSDLYSFKPDIIIIFNGIYSKREYIILIS